MSQSKKKKAQELQKRIKKRLERAGADLDVVVEENAGTETAVSKQVWESRRIALKKEIETMLPSFAIMCKNAERAGAQDIFIHQNAFAAMYSPNEYTLLGKAMKYAGFYGLTINFGGDPTFTPDDAGGPETEDKDHRPLPIKPVHPESNPETD